MKRELLVSLLLAANLWAEPFTQAKVTRAEGSVIKGKSGVQTGPGSKAELEWLDGTVARVGANARFSYTPGTREARLDGGTLLFSSPKDAGGVTIKAGGVTTSAGGAVDFEMASFGGVVKVISLNGKPTVSLGGSRKALKPGGMLDVPAGATKLPRADVVDLKVLVDSSTLLKMGALPSQSKLERNAAKQGVMMPINLPGGANINLVQSALATAKVEDQQKATIEALEASRIAREQEAAQVLAKQQLAAQQAVAAQEQAVQQEQRAQQVTAQQGVSNATGNQGGGNNGNQGNKPNAPPGQANKPDHVPPGQAKKQ
jgi:hypothetical protein